MLRRARLPLTVAVVSAWWGLGAAWPALHAQAPPGQPASSPDLVVTEIDRDGLVGDWQKLTITGTIAATVVNMGDAATGRSFNVVFFEDTDHDRQYDHSADVTLGTAFANTLGAGDSVRVGASVAGVVSFRDNLIYAMADSSDAVAEVNEWNNLRDTGRDCTRAPVTSLEPALEWVWTGSSVQPESRQVMMAPIVIDLDGDELPEVVFSSYGPSGHKSDSHVRAVSGVDGGEVFTIDEPNHEVAGDASLAAGDIDGDGRPEILAVDESWARVIVFEHDGTFKWRSQQVYPDIAWGGPAIADLDADGVPEIVVGRTVLNADGSVRWAGSGGSGSQVGAGTLSVVADLDLDGQSEVVAGNTVYRPDGSVFWRAPAADGLNAIGNFDEDPYAEVVLVADGNVMLFEHDGQPAWGPVSLPGSGSGTFNRGGPPLVADVDSDGDAEIGIAGAYKYTLFEGDGTVKWAADTVDYSSSRTGSSAFDLDGNGKAEVIYADQEQLYVFDGSSGSVVWQTPNTSSTTYEMPVVADVDADGHAEIVVSSNDVRLPGSMSGVRVFGGDKHEWAASRRIWNQHSYHITNVNDDGTIPRREVPSWLAHNTYRMNLPGGLNPAAAPDLTASWIRNPLAVPFAGGSMVMAIVVVRVGNGGAEAVPAGAQVGFYDGYPGMGGKLLDRVQLKSRLEPGEWEDVSIITPPRMPGRLFLNVAADDVGAGKGVIVECNEGNNYHRLLLNLPVLPTRTPEATATQTATATSSPSPAQPSSTPTPSSTSVQISTPEGPLPTWTPEPCVCRNVRRDVPPAVVNDALANPEHYYGWGLRLDPNKPASPANPRRACLALQNPNLRFHPVWNSPVWKVGCP